MSTDWYTKLVLTVVAVCLALMVVQGYRGGAEASASGSEDGRYSLTPLPMARMMLRFDSDTGRTWKATLPDLKVWTPVADSPAEMLEGMTPVAPPPEVMAPEVTAPEAVEPEPPHTP
ncbi:MAG: hypothetical protein ACREI8_03375 [Myxococcota bacterium]